MSATFTNMHLRTQDVTAVREALEQADLTQSKLFGRGGELWVSIYPRATEDGDFELLKAYTFAMSRHMNTAALSIIVQEGINLRFVLYDNGKLLEEFALHPNYPQLSDAPSLGSVDALLPLSIEGTTKQDLEILLCPDPKDRVERDAKTIAQALAHFLAIPRAQVSMGFNHLQDAQKGSWINE